MIPSMCLLLKFNYAEFGVSNLFFQKLSKKNFWRGSAQSSFGKGKVQITARLTLQSRNCRLFESELFNDLTYSVLKQVVYTVLVILVFNLDKYSHSTQISRISIPCISLVPDEIFAHKKSSGIVCRPLQPFN